MKQHIKIEIEFDTESDEDYEFYFEQIAGIVMELDNATMTGSVKR